MKGAGNPTVSLLVAILAATIVVIFVGCAPEVKYIDKTPKVHLLRRASSVDIGEIGFGESLWLKSVPQPVSRTQVCSHAAS